MPQKIIFARLFLVKSFFNCPILFTRLLWGDLQLQLALVDRLPRTPCTHRLHLTRFKFTLWPNSTFFLISRFVWFQERVCLSSKYFSQTLVDFTKHLTMFTPTANYTSYFDIFEQISKKIRWNGRRKMVFSKCLVLHQGPAKGKASQAVIYAN